MTESRRFVIRRAFVVPLGLALLLMGALLAVSVLHGQPAAKVVFLLVFALPVTVLFVVSAFCKVVIDANGVTAIRPFRTKRINFAEVTALESVQVRSRVFLTLTAADDEFLIVSNGYADFPDLVRTLIAALPPAVVTDEARQLAANPPSRHGDLVMVWFMVAALVYVLVAQFQA